MSRKKVTKAKEIETTGTATLEPAAEPSSSAPVGETPESTEQTAQNWGPPYKAIFTSTATGIEMGENRRFKQRVFMFKDKPDEQIIAVLKENGFTYRPAEKAWTIPATAESRLLTDRLAKEFAGQAAGPGMCR